MSLLLLLNISSKEVRVFYNFTPADNICLGGHTLALKCQ